MIDNLLDEINAITWRHKIDLGNGIITPGDANTQKKLKGLGFPDDFEGKSVLDVGAWDGFYSFEAEKRNAGRVLAIDTWTHGAGKTGFNLAKRILNSKVESKTMSVYDLSAKNEGVFDITLFLGVLYHLRHPLLAFDKIAEVTRELIIVESYCVDFNLPDMSLVRFHAHGRHKHKVNYLEPNILFIKEMLKDVGFMPTKQIAYTPGRITIHATKEQK